MRSAICPVAFFLVLPHFWRRSAFSNRDRKQLLDVYQGENQKAAQTRAAAIAAGVEEQAGGRLSGPNSRRRSASSKMLRGRSLFTDGNRPIESSQHPGSVVFRSRQFRNHRHVLRSAGGRNPPRQETIQGNEVL